MLVPEDPSAVNYGGVFEFLVVSAVDGSRVAAPTP